MHKLLDKLKTNKLTLIASIPENSYEFAKAAWEAGADAIKVHINVFHRASQNNFGTLESMKDTFNKILKDSPVPVGIVIGEETFAAEKVMDEAIKMGFDFISLYGHFTPASLVARHDVSKFFAVNASYSFEEINFISNSNLFDILEVSIAEGSTYGERLNARDLARYQYIASNSKLPTVIPTQRVIYPTDVEILHKCGVKAVMVGAISMGKTIESVSSTLREFRKEIDKL